MTLTVAASLADARRLLKMDAHCPFCGKPARLRVEPWVRALFSRLGHNDVVVTYQCHRQECGRTYAVRVEHIASAS